MLELFCLCNLREAVREWGPIRCLLDAVILVFVVLQLVVWCADLVRFGLQR